MEEEDDKLIIDIMTLAAEALAAIKGDPDLHTGYMLAFLQILEQTPIDPGEFRELMIDLRGICSHFLEEGYLDLPDSEERTHGAYMVPFPFARSRHSGATHD